MKIEEQTVVVEVKLWAVPYRSWDDEYKQGLTHEVKAYIHGEPYQEEAVLLETKAVRLHVGEHTDLRQRTIKRLAEARAKVLDEACAVAGKYDDRMQELLALESQ